MLPASTVKALAMPCIKMKTRIPNTPAVRITVAFAGRKKAIRSNAPSVSPISRASILPQRETWRSIKCIQ